MQCTLFQLRLTLLDITPTIERVLLVPDSLSLDIFHGVIQLAMGWENAHLYEFTDNKTRYGDLSMDPAGEMDWLDERSMTLKQLLPKVNSRMGYLYDFVEIVINV